MSCLILAHPPVSALEKMLEAEHELRKPIHRYALIYTMKSFHFGHMQLDWIEAKICGATSQKCFESEFAKNIEGATAASGYIVFTMHLRS